MKIIFNKKFIILISMITLIASISLYVVNDGSKYDPIYTIVSLITFKYAYTFDNWERLVRYRKQSRKYMMIVLLSLIIGTVFSGLMFYQPAIYFEIDDPFTSLILFALKFMSITICFIIFYMTIRLDEKIEMKLRDTIKCSDFEECDSCYKKSCINCRNSKITNYDSIKIELIKENKFYLKRLGSSYEKIINNEIRESEIKTLESILKDKYKNEEFNSVYDYY